MLFSKLRGKNGCKQSAETLHPHRTRLRNPGKNEQAYAPLRLMHLSPKREVRMIQTVFAHCSRRNVDAIFDLFSID